MQEAERREQLRYLEFQVSCLANLHLEPSTRDKEARSLLKAYDRVCLPWCSTNEQKQVTFSAENAEEYYKTMMKHMKGN